MNINDWLRQGGGHPSAALPDDEAALPHAVVLDVATVLGLTMSEARRLLSQGQAGALPKGNAGAGTRKPPQRKMTMTEFIRRAAGR